MDDNRWLPLQSEFDERKSRINKVKHGIDFAEVQARRGIEPRFVVIGRIGGTRWSAVVTYRGECVRLISVRRSRFKEVATYESQ
jgi:uncharacterized DUF497 family protein